MENNETAQKSLLEGKAFLTQGNYGMAIARILDAADLNDPEGTFLASLMYFSGTGIQRNLSEASMYAQKYLQLSPEGRYSSEAKDVIDGSIGTENAKRLIFGSDEPYSPAYKVLGGVVEKKNVGIIAAAVVGVIILVIGTYFFFSHRGEKIEKTNAPVSTTAPVASTNAPTVVTNSGTGISQLDGYWYSSQWKYGYELKNGIGTATSSNSSSFAVGDKIINLAPAGKDMFEGVQVYKDGNFYKVTATLLPDGRLYFQGEKNVNWYMDRVSGPSATVPARSAEQQDLNAWTFLESNGNSMTYYNPKSIERSGRLVGVVTVVTYPYPSKVFFSNVKVGSFTQNMVFRCDRGVYNVVRVAAYSEPMGQGDQLPTNPIDTAREWPVSGGFANIYNQYCR